MAITPRRTTPQPQPGPVGNVERKPIVEEKLKIEILEEGTILNGHVLPAGAVVELTASDIDNHRDHGLRFGPVADDDTRDIFDVSEPYKVPDSDPA